MGYLWRRIEYRLVPSNEKNNLADPCCLCEMLTHIPPPGRGKKVSYIVFKSSTATKNDEMCSNARRGSEY